ncbi:MAG: TrkA family potassium uptake protein [Firmicutes bacterium]|uniref:TrkA family potassium uptake protein n=1 Tax=Candidatus Stercoripulliclostridium pullicola TaxID=2840953 RepID=A0A940DHY0_9FIRM|nr:TrkA family potassium uptake protein [Candidatus Stercoripulliclostridium pullicola]
MKSVLLIGLGRFGRHIAMKLNSMNCHVMAVDNNEERVNAVLPYVTDGIIGDSTNENFLSSLGVKDYDACIVAIGDDFQSSLETASLLKELGAKKVIARASRGVQEKFLLRNGADEVVYPEKQLAAWTAVRCVSDNVLDYIELGNDYSIFEIAVPENWVGKSILDLDVRRKYNLNVLAVRKHGDLKVEAVLDDELQATDSLLVLGREKDIQKCFKI